MRKLLTSVAAIAISVGISYGMVKAVNLPLFSNIALQEPSQELAALNSLVQALNFGTTGNLAYTPGPIGNLATTVGQTFASALVPTGQLTSAGQGIRARCYGQTANTTASKTINLMIFAQGQTPGSISATAPIISSTALNIGNENWDLELQYQVQTNPVTANAGWIGRSFVGNATPAGSTVATVSPVNINSGQDTNQADNLATNGLVVACQYVNSSGAGAASATMQGFIVEQMK